MILSLKGRNMGIRKIVIVLTIIFSMGALLTLNAAAQSIGVVNLAKVTESHPNTEKINELSQELRTELQTRQEELNQEGKGLEESELKKLEEKFNEDWEPVKQKMLTQLQSLQAERNSDIIEAVKAVGEKGNYETIINSEVPVFTGNDMNEYPIILYGGDNVTQDVITEVESITASQ